MYDPKFTDNIMGATPELRRMYLKQRQSLPLNVKVALTKRRIAEWYEAHNGMVYVAFSGGKDSTVLLHLVRSLYPEVPAVFADTGLEYPEIREFVKQTENVVWVKPRKNFKQVIEEYGYPVVSKTVSMVLQRYHNTKDEVQKRLRLYGGINPTSGREQKQGVLPKKWRFLLGADFRISEKCCDIMKKAPMKSYEKGSKRKAIVGVMASDSDIRLVAYTKLGCNSFIRGTSTPMAFWTEDDVWEYLKAKEVPYCNIYDKGERRTGCIFCMFGMEHDKERFVRLKELHPDLHKYCIEKLGLGKVLDYMGYPY